MAVGVSEVDVGDCGASEVGVVATPPCSSVGAPDVAVGEAMGASAVRVSDRPGQSLAGVGLNKLQPASRIASARMVEIIIG